MRLCNHVLNEWLRVKVGKDRKQDLAQVQKRACRWVSLVMSLLVQVYGQQT